MRHVTRLAGGPFLPRRAVVVVLEPVFVAAGCEAVVGEAAAPFETPVFDGAAFFLVGDAGDFARVFLAGDFLVADAGDFATVFLTGAFFCAGVVSSALQASAARAAIAAQIGMVRMF